MGTINTLFSLCTFFSLICILWAKDVPVLMWQYPANQAATNKLIPSLDVLHTKDFQNLVTAQSAQSTIKIVFVADYLRVEDFSCKTVDGVTCYSEVSKIEGKTYIPTVEDPINTLNGLNQRIKELYTTTTGELNENIDFGNDQLILISLPQRNHEEAYPAYIMRHDRLISKLTEDLKKSGKNVLFIYTGQKSEQQLSRKVREANPAENNDAKNTAPKQSSTSAPRFFSNPNFYIYFNDLVKHSGKDESHVEVRSVDVSDVTAAGLRVRLDGDVTVVLQLTQAGSYWVVSNVTVNEVNALNKNNIGAPVGFSYKCSPVLQFKVNVTGFDAISFRGLQIQPKFGSGGDPLSRFSDAYDCVGFTSAGIWAGLFVTFMLLVILTIGISWIMDIRTMDRFDDPKGKTITISATE